MLTVLFVSSDIMTVRSTSKIQIPLSLPLGMCWELQDRLVDSAAFFRVLYSSFTEGKLAFFEGTSIDPDVVQIFQRNASSGPYLPKRQTIWSTSVILQFTCLFTRSLCDDLAAASLQHAEPELFDHFFLYTDHEPLLEWPDAFSNCTWISPIIPEERVRIFAEILGVKYKLVNYANE